MFAGFNSFSSACGLWCVKARCRAGERRGGALRREYSGFFMEKAADRAKNPKKLTPGH